MKKNMLKTVFAVLACSTVLFTSCHGVIFDTIRDEVELEDAQVQGDINSIVRCTVSGTEYLFVTNGKIWRKLASQASSGWTQMTKPVSGSMSQIIKLAADNNYLYALTVTYVDNEDDGENQPSTETIWYSSDGGSSWTAIGDISSSQSAVNDLASLTDIAYSYYPCLFCTNSVYTGGRKAYVRIGSAGTSTNAIYELSGSTVNCIYDSSTSESTGTATTSTKNCAYFNGNVYFSDNYAIETNGSDTDSDDADFIYTCSSDSLYWYDNSSKDFSGSFSNYYDLGIGTILSIAPTADYILLGTSDGIEHVAHTSGVPASATSDFSTNADSTLSSYYEIWNVLAVDPSANETAGTIYGTTVFTGSSSSTSATFDNTGLWAYYTSRSSWNRE